jgi:hypothetical protein
MIKRINTNPTEKKFLMAYLPLLPLFNLDLSTVEFDGPGK